jgi:PAS domain S-box-containing protein
VIYADRSGTIMRWNCGATLLFGYSDTDPLGQTLDLIIPEHQRVIGAVLQQP